MKRDERVDAQHIPTYPIVFGNLTQHDDCSNVLFQNHLPHIGTCIFHGTLAGYVLLDAGGTLEFEIFRVSS